MPSRSLVFGVSATTLTALLFPAGSTSLAAKPTSAQPCERLRADAGGATAIQSVIKRAELRQDLTDVRNVANLGYDVDTSYFDAVWSTITVNLLAAPCAGSTYSVLAYRLIPDSPGGSAEASPVDVTTFRGEDLPSGASFSVDALMDAGRPHCLGLALQTRDAAGDVVGTTRGLLVRCKDDETWAGFPD